jgi:hypothetical protein
MDSIVTITLGSVAINDTSYFGGVKEPKPGEETDLPVFLAD